MFFCHKWNLISGENWPLKEMLSLYYLTHITSVWGCMEILPTHCGAGSAVKVNYYRCMGKIRGLVKPHKVNKLQMRLSYRRIYFNTVCNMKKTEITLHK